MGEGGGGGGGGEGGRGGVGGGGGKQSRTVVPTLQAPFTYSHTWKDPEIAVSQTQFLKTLKVPGTPHVRLSLPGLSIPFFPKPTG